jgi:hypothetical protein
MSKICTISRWFLGIVLGLFLIVFIILGLVLLSVSRIITDSQSLKSWLREAEVYQQVPNVTSTLIEDQMESSDEGLGELPIEGKQLSKVIGKVVTPQWVQSNVETVIDSGYIWLDGETDIPHFQIDLNDRLDILVVETKNLFSERMKELPDCTSQQEQNLSQEEFNPFETECNPSFFTEDALAQLDDQMREEMGKKLEENEMVKEGVLYSEDLIEMKSEEVENIQMLYSHAKRFPLYTLGIVFLISLVVFLLVPGISNKLVVLGPVWILPSVSMLLGLSTAKKQFYNVYRAEIQNIDIEAQDKIIGVINGFVDVAVSDIVNRIRQYSVIVFVIGFIALVGGILLKIGKKDREEDKVVGN